MESFYRSNHLGGARIGARVYDVQKQDGPKINGWRDPEEHSLYWYQIKAPRAAFRLVLSGYYRPALGSSRKFPSLPDTGSKRRQLFGTRNSVR